MSKLSDAMRRVSRRESRPIGFAVATAQKNPTMLVLARGTAAQAAAIAAAGADAVLLTDAPAAGAAPAALWGSAAALADREAAKALREAGAGFVVFDAATTPASALLEDELGFVMSLALDTAEATLRTIEALPLDALLVTPLSGALTVQRSLDLRRVTAFARKPLLMPVDAAISATDLETLRDNGVIGVVVEGVAAAGALREMVDGLPPRKRAADGRGASIALRATGSSYEVQQFPPEEPEEE